MRISLRFLPIVLCIALLPSSAAMQNAEPTEQFSTAVVVSIPSSVQDSSGGIPHEVQTVLLRILNGAEKGKEVTLENGVVDGREDMRLEVGEKVVLDKITDAAGQTEYLIKEAYRLPSLFWLTLVFIAVTIALGGITGITSLLGLAVSVLTLILFVIPRIVAGDNPMVICLIGAAIIACTSIYLAHGLNRRTSVALLSTLITLAIAAITAYIFVHASQLFGMGSEESLYLQTGMLQNVDLRGLLLGGIIIGCLGVLDDVTTAQCAAIDEISKANPSMTQLQLQRAGFSIGREHIASLINTLALAYAGASLPLLLLFKTQDTYPLWVTLNSEFLSEEIIRTLVGSLTLVCAVPVSTFLAAKLLRAAPNARPVVAQGFGHHHHH